MKISFITSVLNRLELTKRFLQSLEHTVDLNGAQVFLVNDGSTDGTGCFLNRLPTPPYHVITNSQNLGYAKSNNRGAQAADGEYLCFVNNDVILTPGWLDPMMELITRHDDVAAVGNIQIHPDTRKIDHAGVFFDWNGRPRHARQYLSEMPKSDYSEWNATTAACLVVRSSVFSMLRGFDDKYQNGYEDIDLCVRMRMRGYRILVSHQSVIKHWGRSSPGREKNTRKNLELLLSKWGVQTRAWGEKEWATEYLKRARGRWWANDPLRLAIAAFLTRHKTA